MAPELIQDDFVFWPSNCLDNSLVILTWTRRHVWQDGPGEHEILCPHHMWYSWEISRNCGLQDKNRPRPLLSSVNYEAFSSRLSQTTWETSVGIFRPRGSWTYIKINIRQTKPTTEKYGFLRWLLFFWSSGLAWTSNPFVCLAVSISDWLSRLPAASDQSQHREVGGVGQWERSL